jgi:hypothetical protein
MQNKMERWQAPSLTRRARRFDLRKGHGPRLRHRYNRLRNSRMKMEQIRSRMRDLKPIFDSMTLWCC